MKSINKKLKKNKLDKRKEKIINKSEKEEREKSE